MSTSAESGVGRLQGKKVVVLGVGGIGQQTALTLAAAGANLWALDNNRELLDATAEGIRAAGGQVETQAVDALDDADLVGAIDRAADALGGVDVFLTTVGGSGAEVSFLDIEIATWRRTVDLNLTSAFVAAQAAARRMAGQGHGSIILTSSQLSISARPGQAAYCASKAGINHLVKVMANDLAPYNIRTNALAPGPTWTPMAQQLFEAAGSDQSWIDSVTTHIPIGRWGTPEDLANAALFLASDESTFITGTTLVVDGGYTTL
ncbi:SDR family oxidoreductase [Microbacterium sp. X-17]|uniref:SDR family NAD(P)-dependent oxidoreductase n=1 Tax=Microbacterium sp. X-17 TaxID=3144404 RepID=UPI0031F5A872